MLIMLTLTMMMNRMSIFHHFPASHATFPCTICTLNNRYKQSPTLAKLLDIVDILSIAKLANKTQKSNRRAASLKNILISVKIAHVAFQKCFNFFFPFQFFIELKMWNLLFLNTEKVALLLLLSLSPPSPLSLSLETHSEHAR